MVECAGIDYSMTCPAICVGSLEPSPVLSTLKFYFTCPNEKLRGPWCKGRVIGSTTPSWVTHEERFNYLAEWAMKCLQLHPNLTHTLIEGYSMGSKGMTFHIGENTGVLKHALWKSNRSFAVAAPTVIKKFATTKGNATKDMMYDSFVRETNYLGFEELTKSKIISPLTDLVDAYYLYRYAALQNSEPIKITS